MTFVDDLKGDIVPLSVFHLPCYRCNTHFGIFLTKSTEDSEKIRTKLRETEALPLCNECFEKMNEVALWKPKNNLTR